MIRERVEELRRQLEYHNFRYYVENAPEISDFEFDTMMRELQDLERAHPELSDPNSPSVRVGSDITSEFRSVKHRFPMLSLGNTYSLDELHEFIARIEKEAGPTEFVCELKFDGTAISLTYEDGRLLRAVTRGDGTQGDDVTANVRTVRTVPLRLRGDDWPPYFEIRGEILMPYASFDKINAEREAAGETLFANPRNAAAGTHAAAWTARSTSWRATTCPSRTTGKACRKPASGDSKSRTRRAYAALRSRSTPTSRIGTRGAMPCPSRPTAW